MTNPLAKDEIRALRRQKAKPETYQLVADRYRATAARCERAESAKLWVEVAEAIEAAKP